MRRGAHKIVAGALLGLPAALLAHILVFGHEHAAGGSMDGALVQMAVGFGFLSALVVAIGASRVIRAVVPRMSTVLAGSTLWFTAIEFTEAQHHLSPAIAIAALALASWIVVSILRAFAHTIVAIVQAVWHARRGAPRTLHAALSLLAPVPANAAHRFRIFSRPPPLLS